MYRRAMLDEIGGFDEEFFAYADDAELGLRGRIAGWTCLYAPGAVVRHHRGATLGLGSARRLTLIERNRVLLAVKLFPWNLLWLNGAYYLARIGAGLWAALRNRGELRRYSGTTGKLSAAMALVRGTSSALPLIPSMLRKRRAFRSKRRLTPRQIRRLLLRHRISLAGDLRTGDLTSRDPAPEDALPRLRLRPEMRILFSATDRLYRTTDKIFQIVECRNCRLIRLHPQPSPLELRDYYPPRLLVRSRKPPRPIGWSSGTAASCCAIICVSSSARCENPTKQGLVLDVGCGGGLFLQMLRRAAQSARRRSGFFAGCRQRGLAARRRPGRLRDAFRALRFAPGSCAAVTMFHVLEHLYDPASYLDAAHQLLRPDGRLILQVPNAACWQFLLLGERWNGIDVPRHLIDFRLSDIESRCSITAASKFCATSIFRCATIPPAWPPASRPMLDPMARRLRQRRRNSAPAPVEGSAVCRAGRASLPFTLLEAACRAGSTIMVEARKKS